MGPIIISKNYTNTMMILWVGGNITGIPKLNDVKPPSPISNSTPIININSTLFSAGLTWIQIENLTVDNASFVYMTIECLPKTIQDDLNRIVAGIPPGIYNLSTYTSLILNLTENFSMPKFMQLKYGKNVNNEISPFPTLTLKYETSPLKYNFSGLANNTYYRIMLYAARDPSDFSKKSALFAKIQNTSKVVVNVTKFSPKIMFSFAITFALFFILAF